MKIRLVNGLLALVAAYAPVDAVAGSKSPLISAFTREASAETRAVTQAERTTLKLRPEVPPATLVRRVRPEIAPSSPTVAVKIETVPTVRTGPPIIRQESFALPKPPKPKPVVRPSRKDVLPAQTKPAPVHPPRQQAISQTNSHSDLWKKKAETVKQNSAVGRRREAEGIAQLKARHPDTDIQKEHYLRDQAGKRAKDPLTGEGRRVDAVKFDKTSAKTYEITGPRVNKTKQSLKEERILDNGGNYVRDRTTKKLHKINKSKRLDVR